MAEIKFEGIAKLNKGLKKRMDMGKLKSTVKKNGSAMDSRAKRNAVFKGHYAWEEGKGMVFKKPTGNLKRSIDLEISPNGLKATVEPKAEYAAYVELGTRKMEAQPYLKPAFEEQKKQFEKDLQKLVR